MKKYVRSDDPRKKYVVAALKAKSGGNKVTCVYELANSEFQGFQGDCLKGNKSGYEKLGTFKITREEIGIENTKRSERII